MKKSALIIVDGMGIGGDEVGNAASRRTMPFLHSLMEKYGFAILEASGPAVGLDDGQVGNSEVGHLTIGAGRVLPTTLSRIRDAFGSGDWARSAAWAPLRNAKRLHIVGLLSDAGVHAHWTTIAQSARLAAQHGVQQVYLHLFLDGVDSPNGTAPALLAQVAYACADLPNVRIASVSGRKWACDRSGDLAISQHCVTGLSGGLERQDFNEAALAEHLRTHASESDFPFHYVDQDGIIAPGEPVVMTQHRGDRVRQLAQALGASSELYSMIQLGTVVPLARVFFPTQSLNQGLVHTLTECGINATRVAETCKFPHVTYFMNGMRNDAHKDAIEIQSLPEDQISTHPEMRLAELQSCVEDLLAKPHEQALIVNLPNLDQVGHTGNLKLAERAAEQIDGALRAICDKAQTYGWNLVITADHGNADRMLDEHGRPVGSHSSNPVPLLVIDGQTKNIKLQRKRGTLANVAATFLTTMGLTAPSYMYESLVEC